MSKTRLSKPLEEHTDEELLERVKSLRDLKAGMVGTLYPGIVQDELDELSRELWKRNVQVEYSPQHAPGRTCRAGHP